MTLSTHTLTVGTRLTRPVVTNLTRSALVQYAGASGDYNPLHTDEVYAREIAGNETVMAHGMLTMGLTATALTGVVGEGALTRYGGRFLGSVWPGDSLTVSIEVTDVQSRDDGRHVRIELTTVNQHGVPVFSGSAEAVV
ncbi:MAG: putative dehydrogenase [Aeromicrobium sp.]|nr:putative dehydrogenase [Aeromicrobium sp.]